MVYLLGYIRQRSILHEKSYELHGANSVKINLSSRYNKTSFPDIQIAKSVLKIATPVSSQSTVQITCVQFSEDITSRRGLKVYLGKEGTPILTRLSPKPSNEANEDDA